MVFKLRRGSLNYPETGPFLLPRRRHRDVQVEARGKEEGPGLHQRPAQGVLGFRRGVKATTFLLHSLSQGRGAP